jgi:Na+-translocating ferredoxin:NAD+ oxidoreductase RnfD subunit
MENYCIAVALILAALAVILTKGSRWFVTSLMLLQLWLLACAKEVAGMALTGRWL